MTDPNPITYLTQLAPRTPNDEVNQSDLIVGILEIERCLPAYRLAKLFAQGDAKELFASDTVRKALMNSVGMYRLNVAGTVISSRTDRMSISAMRVMTGGKDSDEATARLQDEVWMPNEMPLEIPGFIDKTCTYGDAYLIVWPKQMDTPDEETGYVETRDGVDIFVNTPETMRVFYSAENPREIDHAVKTWVTKGDYLRVDIYYEDRLERYISITSTDGVDRWESENQFRPYDNDDQEAVIAHDYGMCVFHARTARPYGRPEHRDAYGPQNAITKLVASHMSSVDWAAFPYRYRLSKSGTTGADLNDWAKNNGQAPDPKSSKVDGQPGTMNKLTNTDAVGQLDAAPAATFLEPISQYMRYLASITKTPLDKIDSTGRPETGESRRAREASLIKRVDYLMLEIGSCLEKAAAHALKLLGVPDPTVIVTWAPAEATDDTDFWTSVAKKQEAGVPRSVALVEAGYLEPQVTKWAESDEEDTLTEKLKLMDQLAAVAVQLGQAVTFGSLTELQAQEIMGQFLPGGPLKDAPNDLETPKPPAPIIAPPVDPNADPAKPPVAPNAVKPKPGTPPILAPRKP